MSASITEVEERHILTILGPLGPSGVFPVFEII
jgi:hypothetical protein